MPNIAEDIRNGDEKAFEMFYRLEFNNLVHFITSYTSDRERSRDLAQEVLCTLWESRESIRPEANLRAWVFTIARNRTLNLLKERRLFSDPSLRFSVSGASYRGAGIVLFDKKGIRHPSRHGRRHFPAEPFGRADEQGNLREKGTQRESGGVSY